MDNQPDKEKEKIGSVDQERIDQFKKDVKTLSHIQPKIFRTDIGKKMGVKGPNFSNYVNGNLPLTENFLTKFYEAWGEELKKRKRGYRLDPMTNSDVKDPADGFKKSYKDKYLAMLEKNNNGLLSHLAKIDDHMTRADENTAKLVDSVGKLVENHQTLMNVHLSLLGQRGGKTD